MWSDREAPSGRKIRRMFEFLLISVEKSREKVLKGKVVTPWDQTVKEDRKMWN